MSSWHKPLNIQATAINSGRYSARHPDAADSPYCVPSDPRGGAERDSLDPAQPEFPVPRKVIKEGGSFLCADRLLPALPPGGPPPADGRDRHEPHRL